MGILSRIKEFLTIKADNAVIANTSHAERLNSAALKIINEIDRLRKGRAEIIRLDAERVANAGKHNNLCSEMEQKIIMMHEQGLPVSEMQYKIALQHKRMAEGYEKQRGNPNELLEEIDKSVIALHQKLSDIQYEIQYEKMAKEATDIGVSCIEDVVLDTTKTEIEVDTLLLKSKTFNNAVQQSSIDTIDIAMYAEELKKRATK